MVIMVVNGVIIDSEAITVEMMLQWMWWCLCDWGDSGYRMVLCE